MFYFFRAEAQRFIKQFFANFVPLREILKLKLQFNSFNIRSKFFYGVFPLYDGI